MPTDQKELIFQQSFALYRQMRIPFEELRGIGFQMTKLERAVKKQQQQISAKTTIGTTSSSDSVRSSAINAIVSSGSAASVAPSNRLPSSSTAPSTPVIIDLLTPPKAKKQVASAVVRFGPFSFLFDEAGFAHKWSMSLCTQTTTALRSQSSDDRDPEQTMENLRDWCEQLINTEHDLESLQKALAYVRSVLSSNVDECQPMWHDQRHFNNLLQFVNHLLCDQFSNPNLSLAIQPL
jgi:hypothetical protein